MASLIKNTGKLAGKTIFVSGGSRGIGKEIALKAARDGANVTIAAKTADPNPKLEGTIYTAAKESEFEFEQNLNRFKFLNIIVLSFQSRNSVASVCRCRWICDTKTRWITRSERRSNTSAVWTFW